MALTLTILCYIAALYCFASAAPYDGHGPTSSQNDADNLNLVVEKDGSYKVNVRGQTWLTSAPTFFNVDGQPHEEGGTLALVVKDSVQGSDHFGRYTLYNFQYQAASSRINTNIRVYEDRPFVYFSQNYETGAKGTQAANVEHTISGFPSFRVQEVTTQKEPLGYLAYGGIHTGDTGKQLGIFSPSGLNITDGLDFGPIALFDGSGDALVISPANNFMSVSNWVIKDGDTNTLSYGIMGGVHTVPVQFGVEFLVYYCSLGVNQAFEGWGGHLRDRYGRTDKFVNDDLSINYLGYWTDNGAYYYYLTEPQKTYQQTILDVKANADQLDIPYKYVQYDSWWYYRGNTNGVKTWVARPDIFPDGFVYLYKNLGLPTVAHNRYWANDTTYAKANGGQYNFILESSTGRAVPNDQKFWDDLLRNASSWGLITYEQDWLNAEFDGVIEPLHSDVTLGDTWLTQMASAAAKNKMTIQYCMAGSRHIMHALQTPVVTQARASMDYHPGRDQWKIGVSSIFSYAMRIAPFKDNFWSTSDQPGNKYKQTEPSPETQVIVSVLSTGPVGPSDRIGYSNVSLIMRCCNAEGLILKPSKPATAIDDQIYQTALGSNYNGANGEVWTTYSAVGGLRFGIIFVPNITGQYSITPTKAGFNMTKNQLAVFEAHDTRTMAKFSEEQPLHISGCVPSTPCIYHATPLLTQYPPVFLLGELTKVVPVSPQRVTSIDVTGNEVKLYLQGVPNEVAHFTFSVDSNMVTISCQFGSRSAVLDLNAKSCQ
ncbi:uncharacterized protein [Littorina saxatilis]|uniref:Uncharacterized protein n=1 Tax=Littorina saxatilis TaxID=31220 RepID=A0AAN9BCJ8_9CAEN